MRQPLSVLVYVVPPVTGTVRRGAGRLSLTSVNPGCYSMSKGKGQLENRQSGQVVDQDEPGAKDQAPRTNGSSPSHRMTLPCRAVFDKPWQAGNLQPPEAREAPCTM